MTRWGILSTARISETVMLAAGARVVAVASRERDRAEAFAARHGIDRVADSYAALLADPEIDAIYNPLPNSLHLEWSVRALEAGKHVLCEKPLGRRAADVAAAFDAAERAGRILIEGFYWRHHPQVGVALEVLAGGAIGRPLLLRSCCGFPLDDPGDIRMRRELDGGALMDVGCYCVHGARQLLGAEPLRVHAERAQHEPGGVDVSMAAILRFPGDVVAIFDCSLVAPERSELEIVGEAGTLTFADPWPIDGIERELFIEIRRADGVERVAIATVNASALQLAHVEACIRGEAEPLLGRADAVGQARVIGALFESAGRGAAVEL